MSFSDQRLSEEAARAVWLRAARLQAEAERRAEERLRELPPTTGGDDWPSRELDPDEVRAAAEEAGISPEFVQIALAEARASTRPALAGGRWDTLGPKLFLGASDRTLEVTATVPGTVAAVAAAVVHAFSGHPCLLQTGEVAELPSTSGRVIVFNVPRFDWSVTANPPFVEKAAWVGLRQLHVAIRPVGLHPAPTCEVVVAGDLHPGMRTRWRWSAGTAVGASAAGGAAGVGMASATVAGALLAVPALIGAGVASAAAVAAWALAYRTYRSQVHQALEQTLQLLPAAARALAGNEHGRGAGRELPRARERPGGG